MKVLIVGAVAGGASAAARLRRLDEDAEILLIERGEAPSFANCGLPYYIGGVIDSRNKLLITPEQRLRDRYRIDIRTRTEALKIDRQAKTVLLRDLQTRQEYLESYDKLILSPGATPLRPPIPGVDLPQVYTLRDLHDADLLLRKVAQARKAVVIGGGFIGLEMTENLVQRGIETTVVELADQVLPPWDAEMVSSLTTHLRSNGVHLELGDAAEEIISVENRLSIRLRSGKELDAEFVVLSVGVRPENKLAVEAGLEVGPRGGIRVNEQMQSCDPDIYAVGDAIEVYHFVARTAVQIPLGGPANRQGRIAADHLLGRPSRYRGTQGTAVVGVFGMTASMTGLSEKSLREAGTAYEKAYLHPSHHASYFPGSQQMSIKLLFAPESGKILGAQIVGREGVDKRIDVLAVAIQAGMTVFDLEEMELAYAPQYGSAKDPINMAGFVAAGILNGLQPVVHGSDLFSRESEYSLIDVRTAEEYAGGHIPGAINIPLEALRGRLNEIRGDSPVVTYCQVGQRGYLATRILAQRGFQVANLSGGLIAYQQHEASRQES